MLKNANTSNANHVHQRVFELSPCRGKHRRAECLFQGVPVFSRNPDFNKKDSSPLRPRCFLALPLLSKGCACKGRSLADAAITQTLSKTKRIRGLVNGQPAYLCRNKPNIHQMVPGVGSCFVVLAGSLFFRTMSTSGTQGAEVMGRPDAC